MGPRPSLPGAVACVLAPEMTEGPYFVEGDKVRRNITEGKPGVPLALRLTVVDASTCRPIRNAAVDVWHCDAGGTYSATSQEGTEGLTFLRGIQRTDRNGLATFKTIYPWWYPGRAVHIHLKVFLGGTTVHTGQLFFADRVTDIVYKRPHTTGGRTGTRGMPETRTTGTAAHARCSGWRRAATGTSGASRWE